MLGRAGNEQLSPMSRHILRPHFGSMDGRDYQLVVEKLKSRVGRKWRVPYLPLLLGDAALFLRAGD